MPCSDIYLGELSKEIAGISNFVRNCISGFLYGRDLGDAQGVGNPFLLLLPSSCSEKIDLFILCYQQNDAIFCSCPICVGISILAENRNPLLFCLCPQCLQLLSFLVQVEGELFLPPPTASSPTPPGLHYFYFHPPKRRRSHGTWKQCSVPATPRWSTGPAALQEKVVPKHTCSVAFLHSSPSASFPCSLCCCISYIMSMCNVHPSITWMKLFIFELQEYQRKYFLSKVVLISVGNKCFCKPLRSWNSWNKWN